jgi:hypothetical protein
MLLCLALLGACGGEPDEALCGGAGCDSGATVKLPRFDVPDDEELTVRVCVRRHCGETRLLAGESRQTPAYVAVPIKGRTAAVVITVRGSSRAVLARGAGSAPVKTIHPNGPECPPTCQRIRVQLTRERVIPVSG